ncbi:hypothetical protein [Duganella sp. HH101]|uniref:hypothetical protein n=1 Tax=Duganella sp. HH101 TaxID=1781066 RepID=UPI000893EFF0|nr:hypothetical protein [Duganella sp. HH101]OFA04831.1 hypothetical protein DUGA2_15740 [Duganella sp. HH101]
MNPQRMPNSKRQRLITNNGTVLERAYVFMPPESWAALQRLSIKAHRSHSQLIEELVAIANTPAKRGDNKETHDKTIIEA